MNERMIHPEDYRDYQIEARDAVFGDFEAGVESALIVMPTGSGKTVLAGMCVEAALSMGRRTLFLAHRENLINQAYKTLSYFGLDAAVEMGASNAKQHVATFGMPDAVVGSVQTLQDNRLMRWAPDTFDYIIIDECHRALADSYTKILNWFNGYKLLGITATPKRGDERNLGARFHKKSFEYRLRRAIEEQWLVPIRTRTCPTSVNLRGIKIVGSGDFPIGELEERIGPNIEQLARGFQKEIGQKTAVAFLPDVGSAMAFAQVLSELGTPARYAAGAGGHFGMAKPERNANLEAFQAREFQVITCNELLVEGWDCPHVEAVGILRPTTQQYRYMQMVGRGTRPSPLTGKTECLVIDFDWETDESSKDLCTTVELFNDGSVNEEVFAVAREIAASKKDEDIDPLEVIDDAERIVRTRQRFRIRLTGKEEKYRVIEHNPTGVAKLLDIKLNRKYDLDRQGDNPASFAQLGMLRGLSVQAPEGLSKWGASKMIDKLLKRKAKGESSASQVQALLSNGVDADQARDMSFEEAKAAITDIDTYNRAKAKIVTPTQRSFFS